MHPCTPGCLLQSSRNLAHLWLLMTLAQMRAPRISQATDAPTTREMSPYHAVLQTLILSHSRLILALQRLVHIAVVLRACRLRTHQRERTTFSPVRLRSTSPDAMRRPALASYQCVLQLHMGGQRPSNTERPRSWTREITDLEVETRCNLRWNNMIQLKSLFFQL